MSEELLLRNVFSYSLQLALVVTAGALLPALVGLRSPRARLAYWQILLVAAALALPALQPWRTPRNAQGGEVTATTMAGTVPQGPGRSWPTPRASWALWLLAAGAVTRACWLGLGFWRLHQYKRRARPIESPDELSSLSSRLAVWPDLFIASEVSGPVTFGLLRPAVIFPERFFALPEPERRAVACHEFLHVRRCDWLFTVSEEVLRCALWFHPAVWWLLARIQLAREQAVDHATVLLLADRERYLETLLGAAAARAGVDLAPAPLFLRKRHLSQRVASLLKETPMSKPRLVSSLVTISGVAILAMCLSVALFPLTAPAQELTLDPGVTVDMGAYHLLHAAPIPYPPEAQERNLEGIVQLELSVNPSGAVTDARVLSGKPELRKAALLSALQWHFSPDTPLPSVIPVHVQFRLTQSSEDKAPAISLPNGPVTVKQILFTDLSEAIKDKLLHDMPVRVGDSVTAESLDSIRTKLAAMDEHLALTESMNADGSIGLNILLRQPHQTVATAPLAEPAATPSLIRVGGNVQASKLVKKITPLYPPLAKAARIQGKVRYTVVIGKDGTVQSLDLVSGHPLLAEAATPAVKQWVYQTTLLNGEPVEVKTQVDVNFTLSQ